MTPLRNIYSFHHSTSCSYNKTAHQLSAQELEVIVRSACYVYFTPALQRGSVSNGAVNYNTYFVRTTIPVNQLATARHFLIGTSVTHDHSVHGRHGEELGAVFYYYHSGIQTSRLIPLLSTSINRLITVLHTKLNITLQFHRPISGTKVTAVLLGHISIFVMM